MTEPAARDKNLEERSRYFISTFSSLLLLHVLPPESIYDEIQAQPDQDVRRGRVQEKSGVFVFQKRKGGRGKWLKFGIYSFFCLVCSKFDPKHYSTTLCPPLATRWTRAVLRSRVCV